VRRPETDVLREAARRAIAASGLRPVAAAIGVSHSGLKKFIEGAEPYSPTFRKLQEWYLRALIPDGYHDDEVKAIAAAVLLQDFAPKDRENAARELVEMLVRLFRKAGREPPGWVNQLTGNGARSN
jgi:hypothetical protein